MYVHRVLEGLLICHISWQRKIYSRRNGLISVEEEYHMIVRGNTLTKILTEMSYKILILVESCKTLLGIPEWKTYNITWQYRE